jgi:predicted N-formylglutamate amidohydrolase
MPGGDCPQEYGDLGLPAAEFDRHIAYDIGVEAVTRRLARGSARRRSWRAFSRLLIDPNRGEDDPTLIRQLYDGTIVPANYPMSDEEREYRLERFYRPYHDAVGSMIAAVAAEPGKAPLHLLGAFLHAGHAGPIARPWHVGVLWDIDDRAVRPLLDMLAADPHWWSATTSPMTARCAATPCSATPSSTAMPMR